MKHIWDMFGTGLGGLEARLGRDWDALGALSLLVKILCFGCCPNVNGGSVVMRRIVSANTVR